jgi:uncharacterized protein YdhG (YjbR/CyaY superfamily)
VLTAFKLYIGFYQKETAIKAFAKELSVNKTAEGSIQFLLYEEQPQGSIK